MTKTPETAKREAKAAVPEEPGMPGEIAASGEPGVSREIARSEETVMTEEIAVPREATVPADATGTRLDAYLSAVFGFSRAEAERLLDGGNVEITPGKAKKNYRLCGGERVRVTMPEPQEIEARPENIPLDIVYEDADVAVINKPAGMVVHPAAGNPGGTLVNALLYHCRDSLSGVGGALRPGIVHRIDKDTSGLLVVAKNDAAHRALAAQLETHTVCRVYEAIVLGNLKEDSGTVDAPVGRHPTDRKKMAVLRTPGTGKRAVTHYEVTERFGRFTHIRCRLETGRTHQIRVHMASLGHPLLGDPVYGGGGTKFEAAHRSLFTGQCLHAGELSFRHPATGETVTFYAPLPENLQKILELLRKECYD